MKMLKRLQYGGSGVYFAKMDWIDVYNHVKVQPQDVYLQWVFFLGKVFSSPSIFDRISDIMKTLACIKALFKIEWTLK